MYGFPKELYEVQYHPKGCQKLTDDILALLPDISINDDWGIEGPQNAYDIGKALAPLREKGYLTGLVKKRDNEKIIHYEDNPDAAYAAPTADHFLPLLYTLGAAQGEKPEIFNNVRNTGSLSMTGYLFGFGEK